MPSSITNRYGSIASEIYDIDKPVGRLHDSRHYLASLEGVTGEILEPGCGSGRAMIPLLRAGHTITGFDASPEMLDQCRERCAGLGFAPDLSLRRYEDFDYGRRFAAIVMPVASFTVIGDFDTAAAVLARFHDHLEPGGRLIVDIGPLGGLAPHGDDRRSWTAQNGDLLTLEGIRHDTDWLAQRISYAIRYERWRDNRLVETELEPMTQRFWGVEEFRLLLAASGFGGITLTPDYRPGEPVTGRTRLITYEAVKTG